MAKKKSKGEEEIRILTPKSVKVLKCKCSHEAQDEIYGKGMRLHNHANKDDKWRCTVCGDTKKI